MSSHHAVRVSSHVQGAVGNSALSDTIASSRRFSSMMSLYKMLTRSWRLTNKGVTVSYSSMGFSTAFKLAKCANKDVL